MLLPKSSRGVKKVRYKILTGLILFSLVSSMVFASDNAPPPIPTEYWGRLLIDGDPAPDGTEVNYYNGEEWIITTTVDGWYNIIMTGGDSDLTFLDDHDCDYHWNTLGEACIPCSTTPSDPDYCVEGPKEGEQVDIDADGNPVTVTWGTDASGEENLIALIPLYTGWNMISLPIKKLGDSSPNTLMSTLTGHKVVYYYNTTDTSDHWKGYDSSTPPFTWDLEGMYPNNAYWVKLDSSQTLSLIGTELLNNIFPF